MGSSPTATAAAAFQIATILATSTPTTFQTVPSLSKSFPSPSSSKSPADGSQNTGECELLGPFAILVQAALGGLALLSLVFKRWRERPQRPVKIWAFDASKQVLGSVLLHLANLVMSMFSAGQIQSSIVQAAASAIRAKGDKYQPNPCSFYLLNLGIDTTLGIPILIVILRLLTAGASLTPLANPPESIRSGNYGTPPKVTWWLKQSLLYFIGLLGMKSCVFIVFELLPWIVQVGDWALRWTEGNEAVQIAFVMLIFPLIMNALQYYIIDGFIKNRPPPEEEDSRDEAEEEDALLINDDAADVEEPVTKEDSLVEATKSRSADLSSQISNHEHGSEHQASATGSSGGDTNGEEGALTSKHAG